MTEKTKPTTKYQLIYEVEFSKLPQMVRLVVEIDNFTGMQPVKVIKYPLNNPTVIPYSKRVFLNYLLEDSPDDKKFLESCKFANVCNKIEAKLDKEEREANNA